MRAPHTCLGTLGVRVSSLHTLNRPPTGYPRLARLLLDAAEAEGRVSIRARPELLLFAQQLAALAAVQSWLDMLAHLVLLPATLGPGIRVTGGHRQHILHHGRLQRNARRAVTLDRDDAPLLAMLACHKARATSVSYLAPTRR